MSFLLLPFLRPRRPVESDHHIILHTSHPISRRPVHKRLPQADTTEAQRVLEDWHNPAALRAHASGPSLARERRTHAPKVHTTIEVAR